MIITVRFSSWWKMPSHTRQMLIERHVKSFQTSEPLLQATPYSVLANKHDEDDNSCKNVENVESDPYPGITIYKNRNYLCQPGDPHKYE